MVFGGTWIMIPKLFEHFRVMLGSCWKCFVFILGSWRGPFCIISAILVDLRRRKIPSEFYGEFLVKF